MSFAGRQLTYGECLSLASYVGFSHGHGLLRMVAVWNGESGRYVEAIHENIGADGVTVLSVDRGLSQLNSIHDDQITPEDALKAIPNAAYAYQLSKEGRDFTPWSVFNRRSLYYEDGLKWAAHYYQHGTGWRRRIPLVPELFG
jgi:lysozyme-like protein